MRAELAEVSETAEIDDETRGGLGAAGLHALKKAAFRPSERTLVAQLRCSRACRVRRLLRILARRTHVHHQGLQHARAMQEDRCHED